MFQKIIIFVIIAFISVYNGIDNAIAVAKNGDINGYTTLRTVDLGTFNEYRYKLTEQYFKLREKFNVDRVLDPIILGKIDKISREGYNYLPDNLKNKNFLINLNTELKKGVKYPNNESNYGSIVQSLQAYIESTIIEKVKGRVDAFPKEGNAPLTVTLRGVITDPTGTKIPSINYTWWMDNGGKRKIIGHNVSINYTFKEEGNFSIFLDVKSNHKNVKGYTDVISFRSRADIKIKAKIASVIINVNSNRLNQLDTLKFSPEEAKYGLLFDATSSTPTSGSKFIETSWDFGNGIKRLHSGNPKIERIIYSREGDFTVKLKLKTNENKIVERKFLISIHNPIAKIYSTKDNGFLGDKFTFSTKTNANTNNLTYSWEIVDINNDKVILKNTSEILTYVFNKKGRYSVKLKATDIGGNIDVDTKIISINSRPPVAKFTYKISAKNTPNKVFFDATNSFDPDFTDDGKLKFSWLIDGNRVLLDNPNSKGSTGYYSFDSIGEHSVVLEVTDPDKIVSQKKVKVSIKSILSVDFEGLPRVISRKGKVDFSATSPEALFYEWDFGDGQKTGGKYDKISHVYNESGIFNAKLTVRDKNDNKNSVTKVIYVGESDNPYAFISLKSTGKQAFLFKEKACGNNGAYIVDKVTTLNLSGKESIDITGKNKGLTYSWKIGKNKYFSSSSISYKFDELGCFPVKLTVKSKKNNKTNSTIKWMKVENILPTLSSIEINVKNINSDPVIANLKALGSKDKDGIIQSYLWYYYTDIDPEPQDFRSTIGPSTSFVLPKVTGNYYFVVVMKDNNEAIISSEEITKSKYFITLTGDNINTPIIDLNVNNSSISVGDDVSFLVNVKNILGHDLSKDAKYSWDFDGDGFYDKETNKPNVVYRYNYSGKFHVKVKVKYKGFSNTKSTTLNVINKLLPKFEYISILNKYIFLNLSRGKRTSSVWDFGNGHISKEKDSFVYNYFDKKPVHTVKLKISDGTKVKTFTKEVIKNIKNVLKAKKKNLKIFSYPQINKDNQILVKNAGDKVFVYPGENTGGIIYYSIDYDLSYDSDLNGGKADDSDNKSTSSYRTGDPVEIKLNKDRVQKLRFVTKDDKGEILDSYDFEIVKNYIKEKGVNINEITFKGVSSSEKLKIEKLKALIVKIKQKDRLKSMLYLQKLQDAWFDNTEKTRVILEFESFIDNAGIDKNNNMIGLLESLLVVGEKDKSEKNISFNALKNLVPDNIDCKFKSDKYKTCKEYIIGELGVIKDSTDVKQNKIIGSSILDILLSNTKEKGEKWMSNKNLLDFKAIIKTLIYGSLSSVPDSEKKKVVDAPVVKDNSSGSSLLSTILYSLFIIILIISGSIFAYWLYFKLSKKHSGETFEEFITKKTSNKSNDNKNDILSNLDNNGDNILTEPTVEKKEEISDIFSNNEKEEEVDEIEKEKEDIFNPGVEKKDKQENKEEPIPSSLHSEGTKLAPTKGGYPLKREEIEDNKDKIQENSKEDLDNITKIEEDSIPSWLKASLDNSNKKESIVDKEEKVEEKQDIFNPGVEKEYKKENKEELKEEKVEENKEKENKDNSKVEENSKEDLDNISKVEEDNIPDWLKGSIDEGESKKEDTFNPGVEIKEEDNTKIEDTSINDKLDFDDLVEPTLEDDIKVQEKIIEEKNISKKVINKQKSKKDKENKEDIKVEEKKKEKKAQQKVEKKKEVNKENKNKDDKTSDINEKEEKSLDKKEDSLLDFSDVVEKEDDLWDDGMKIPDWLQTGDDEDKKKKEDDKDDKKDNKKDESK